MSSTLTDYVTDWKLGTGGVQKLFAGDERLISRIKQDIYLRRIKISNGQTSGKLGPSQRQLFKQAGINLRQWISNKRRRWFNERDTSIVKTVAGEADSSR